MTILTSRSRKGLALALVGLAFAGCAARPPLDRAEAVPESAADAARPEPSRRAEVEELVVTSSRVKAARSETGMATGSPKAAAPALPTPPPPAPPPPPPVMAPAAVVAETRVVAARDRVASGEPADARPPRGDVAPAELAIIQHLEHETAPAAARQQAGQITAGDLDDVLNPAAYQAYAQRFRERFGRGTLPLIDATDRLRVTVRGADGHPAPLARVEARAADGRRVALRTKADGQVLLFPGFDRLGREVELTAQADGQAAAPVTVRLTAGTPGEVTLTVPTPARPVRALDVVLVMDTTGSMGDELDYLTAEMADILKRVAALQGGLDVRVGLVFYRDLGDVYTVRTYPFTADSRALERTLAHQEANGGGDTPEAMHLALAQADALPWRDDAAKVMLVVADAPPHAADMPAAWAAAMAARRNGVQIVPVAASGVDDDAQYLMRAMAAATEGRYVFITDDSGIGDSHAEPATDCYVVTRLDELIVRVISSLALGRRVEAEPGTILRQVGRYDRGVCRTRQ